MRTLRVNRYLFCAVATLAAAFGVSSQTLETDPAMEFPVTTEPRVHSAGWWPTKEALLSQSARTDCARCRVLRLQVSGVPRYPRHANLARPSGKTSPVGHSHLGHLPHAPPPKSPACTALHRPPHSNRA